MNEGPRAGLPGTEGEGPNQPRGAIAASAIRASIWVVVGYGAGQVLRFAGNIVLARLLFPEVFGLAALVFVFLTGLQMFSDVGSGPAIVQSPRGDAPGFLNSAWTICAIRGVLLWLGACAVARPLASFYDQPLLASLLPVAGLQAVLGGLDGTSLHQAQRHLRAQAVTFVELATQAVTIAASLSFAWAWRTGHPGDDLQAVWAVIGGALLGAATRLALSHLAVPGTRNRLHLDRESVAQLLHFGRWVFLSSMLTFLAAQSDRLMLGKMVSLEVLGLYGIAVNLALLATQAVQKVGGLVLFPACSRLAATGELQRSFPVARLPLLLGGALIVTGFVTAGPPFIRLVYDSRYAEAGWMLQILAISGWFQVLEATNTAALLAQRQLKWMTGSGAAKLAALAILLPLGMRVAGFRGALACLVLSDAIKYAITALGVSRGGLRCLGQDVVHTGLIAVVSFAGVAMEVALEGRFNALSGFGGAVLVTLLAWGGLALIQLRRKGSAESVAGPVATHSAPM